MISWAKHHPKLDRTPLEWLKEFGPDHTNKELRLLFQTATGEEIGPSVMARARDRYGIELGPKGWAKVKKKLRLPKADPTLEGLDDLQLIEEIQKRGYAAVAQSPIKVDTRIKVPTDRFEGDEYKFGTISCTHLGSKYQQLTHLRSYYALCEQEGIRDIYHAGDFIAGQDVFRGQINEIFMHGADAQRDYAIENYPSYPDVTTHVIGGNHDESHWKKAGSDVLDGIAKERKDIKYYGFYGAFIDIGPVSAYLMHGAGGVAYARSYKLQKIIEQFAPENKPDLLLLGHYHVPCHLPAYRNVEGWTLASFEAQGPYLKRKGLFPVIMGMIIKVRINDFDRKDGIVMVEPKYIPFYVPKEKDW